MTATHSIYDFEALSIDGKPAHLSTQRGKVMLIVNTASQCGFTPQFGGLEKLWEEYRGLRQGNVWRDNWAIGDATLRRFDFDHRFEPQPAA